MLGAPKSFLNFLNHGLELLVESYDRDQAFAGSVSIAVYSAGVTVEQVDNLTGNSWRFDGEASSNGGVLRGELEFRFSTYSAGISSDPIVVSVTRSVTD